MKRALVLLVMAACGDKGSEGPEGPQGPAGPPGPQGPPGQVTVLDGGVLQGPPGPQGPEGPAGATGPAGPAGPTGATGPMGPMGVMGTAGNTGATGPAGPAGPAGAQGVAGSVGTAGGVFGEYAPTFAGFSTTAINGNAGGREKMHAACAAAIAGSHLCHVGEYGGSNSATVPPAGGAWVDGSGNVEEFNANVSTTFDIAGPDIGRYIGSLDTVNCDNWSTSTTGSAGGAAAALTVGPAGVASALCSTSHVLACCSTPYTEKFKGFTTTTPTGVQTGGRAAMHAFCGAQFPGSHMCHAAEYGRANPTVTPPSGGAWLDGSGYLRNAGSAQETSEVASEHMGRYFGALQTVNCEAWSAAMAGGSNTAGLVVSSTGIASALCTTSHAVACCSN